MNRVSRVTVAATSFNLVTVANLKADLGITGSTEDTYFSRQIAAASADVANYCGRQFVVETVEDRFFIEPPTKKIILSRFPVISISSIIEDGTTLTADQYALNNATGEIMRLDDDGDRIIEWCQGLTTIVFQAGYPAIPADLERSIVSLVKARRSARDRDPNVRSERVPDVMETTYWVAGPGEADLPPDIRGVWDRYRAARLG